MRRDPNLRVYVRKSAKRPRCVRECRARLAMGIPTESGLSMRLGVLNALCLLRVVLLRKHSVLEGCSFALPRRCDLRFRRGRFEMS